MAFESLRSQEKSLRRKGPEVMKAKKNHYVQKVPKSQAEDQWFLPHFPVIREDRITTKVHIVFDVSVKHDGKSLNSAIGLGPGKPSAGLSHCTDTFSPGTCSPFSWHFWNVPANWALRQRPPASLVPVAWLWNFKRSWNLRIYATVVWKHCFAILLLVRPSDPSKHAYLRLPWSSRHGKWLNVCWWCGRLVWNNSKR